MEFFLTPPSIVALLCATTASYIFLNHSIYDAELCLSVERSVPNYIANFIKAEFMSFISILPTRSIVPDIQQVLNMCLLS